ncbi:hypothetical protein [Tahibacter amnicola]|uniref:Uncharacterized protein n=1 Tax=Tahibacter amnicola TaxID=2976241 RepID=A0ABY6BLF9_9GAMM|nr:hypothetical protein [Tahibacter amnicola]UXI69875.1 hypothetical protein N4264_09680 [Tahibacter amnicola]
MSFRLLSPLRRLALALVAFCAIAMAPSAFARDYYSISIGGPGYGVTYGNCRHCGGWWSGHAYSGWHSPYYGATYYGPYRHSHRHHHRSYPRYNTVVYERPVVVRRTRYVDRHYYYDDDRHDSYRDHYYDRDRHYHRDRYYDRDYDYDR